MTTFTPEQVQALLAQQQSQKAFINPHGAGGLFGTGVDPDMPVAIPSPSNTLPRLPMLRSVTDDRIWDIFTSIASGTGTETTDPCGTPGTPGSLATMQVTVPWGLFHGATQDLRLYDMNRRRNVADIERNYINGFQQLTNNPMMPDVVGAPNVNTIKGKAMIEYAQNAALNVSHVVYQGSNANTGAAAEGMFAQEFNGADTFIRTGYSAAAADSVVMTATTSWGATEMERVIDMIRSVWMRAEQVGMANAEFELHIHPTFKYELFDTWACNFGTVKCGNDNGRFDLMTTEMRRNEMMRGSYVMLDGQQIPVVADWGMATTFNSSTGVRTTDIQFWPTRWNGRPLTFMEFLPYNIGESTELLSEFDDVRSINGGFYLAGQIRNGAYCRQLAFLAKMRFVMLYPFLAGRVDDIAYTTNVIYRNPYPGSTAYVGGGATAIA